MRNGVTRVTVLAGPVVGKTLFCSNKAELILSCIAQRNVRNIDRSTAVRETFSFADPSQVIRAVEIHRTCCAKQRLATTVVS